MCNSSMSRRHSPRLLLALSLVLSLFVSVLWITPAMGAPAGLVAAYSFDQGSGTTVPDASGTNNTGTLAGATWTTSGKYGGALAFSGTNQRVNIPNAASLQLSYRDDARGLGEPLDHLQRLARRGVQGQRQLLPDGNDRPRPRRNPRRGCDREWGPCGGLRHHDAYDGHVHPSGGHLRRGHAEALRRGEPGGVQGRHRCHHDLHQPAADRRGQHLRPVLRRGDRRGPRLQHGPHPGPDPDRHDHPDRIGRLLRYPEAHRRRHRVLPPPR